MEKMITPEIGAQIEDLFLGLEQPVEILYFGQKADCEYCADVLQLVNEVAELHDLISVQAFDLQADQAEADKYNVAASPSLVIAAKNGDQLLDYGVRFRGAPAGHEFTTLILDLLNVSKRRTDLTEETREYIQTLTEPLLLQVFVTPTCAYCPPAVLLAHQMAMESDLVQAEMVESTEFRDLADEYMVSGVPQTTINAGAGTVVGALPEPVMIERLQSILTN
ncbi:MAG: thioredoxin family protein [Chloroflexota bacterium]